MVATETIRQELREQGLTKLHHWSRGVDLACFSPEAPPPPEMIDLPGPILLYVGRVAVEKNIEALTKLCGAIDNIKTMMQIIVTQNRSGGP